jgi:predicted nucleic acid-binding protein
LLVEEPSSPSVRAVLAEDSEIAAWWGTRVECASALRRVEREGSLDRDEVRTALGFLDELSEATSEILPSARLRLAAERALAVHPLRAADAIQLAAGMTLRGSGEAAVDFVCLDDRLRDAADREGFKLLPR